MSQLTPIIAALRAEAAALTAQCQRAVEASVLALERGSHEGARNESVAATIMVRLSEAKLDAAQALEASEPTLSDEGGGVIQYNPKAKKGVQ